jgi:hypothetical protein
MHYPEGSLGDLYQRVLTCTDPHALRGIVSMRTIAEEADQLYHRILETLLPLFIERFQTTQEDAAVRLIAIPRTREDDVDAWLSMHTLASNKYTLTIARSRLETLEFMRQIPAVSLQ